MSINVKFIQHRKKPYICNICGILYDPGSSCITYNHQTKNDHLTTKERFKMIYICTPCAFEFVDKFFANLVKPFFKAYPLVSSKKIPESEKNHIPKNVIQFKKSDIPF